MKKLTQFIIIVIMAGFVLYPKLHTKDDIIIIPDGSYEKDKDIAKQITEMRKGRKDLIETYKDLRLVDVHNHDADALDRAERRRNEHYTSVRDLWSKYGIDQTVLFGAVSEPAAIKSDKLSWQYYEKYPQQIYPSFAGVEVDKSSNGLTKVKENLEKGYMNIGEIYAASTYSPSSNVKWKGKHPNDGILPEIYELAATYKVPVLLHIDPPSGFPINQFEFVMKNHPDTTFIFAHGNVHTSPQFLRELVRKHDNLIIDFFAGYTAYNPSSKYTLDDFAPIAEDYPDQFVLGSDSGFDIGHENAYHAMYEFIDLLSPNTAAKAAYQNFDYLMERQLPTIEQIIEIKRLAKAKGIANQTYRLNKRQANELIFKLQNQPNGLNI